MMRCGIGFCVGNIDYFQPLLLCIPDSVSRFPAAFSQIADADAAIIHQMAVALVHTVSCVFLARILRTRDGSSSTGCYADSVALERSVSLQYIIVFSPLPGRPLAAGFLVHGDLTLTSGCLNFYRFPTVFDAGDPIFSISSLAVGGYFFRNT